MSFFSLTRCHSHLLQSFIFISYATPKNSEIKTERETHIHTKKKNKKTPKKNVRPIKKLRIVSLRLHYKFTFVETKVAAIE